MLKTYSRKIRREGQSFSGPLSRSRHDGSQDHLIGSQDSILDDPYLFPEFPEQPDWQTTGSQPCSTSSLADVQNGPEAPLSFRPQAQLQGEQQATKRTKLTQARAICAGTTKTQRRPSPAAVPLECFSGGSTNTRRSGGRSGRGPCSGLGNNVKNTTTGHRTCVIADGGRSVGGKGVISKEVSGLETSKSCTGGISGGRAREDKHQVVNPDPEQEAVAYNCSGSPPEASGQFPFTGSQTDHVPYVGRVDLSADHVVPERSMSPPDAVPAQTVVQAQECGELVQIQDDAVYCLDGLTSTSSLTSQRDNATRLAELLSTRKGRLALRSDGLTQQVLTAMARLKCDKDAVLALAAACILVALSEVDAHPCYFASTAVAVLLEQTLKVTQPMSMVEAQRQGPAGQKLVKLLQEGPLLRKVPRSHVLCHTTLVLCALVAVTGGTQSSRLAYQRRFQQNLQRYKVLERIGMLVPRYCGEFRNESGATPHKRQALLWNLNLCLLVLENATLSCPDAETLVLDMEVPGWGDHPEGALTEGGQPLVGILLTIVDQLHTQLKSEVESEARDCVHSSLAVLMNLTNMRRPAISKILAMGAVATAGRVLVQCCGGQECLPGSAEGAEQTGQTPITQEGLLKNMDLLSVALGLLINLVAGSICAEESSSPVGSAESCQDCGEAPAGGVTPEACCAESLALVPYLTQILGVVSVEDNPPEGPSPAPAILPEEPQTSYGAWEVTEQSMQDQEQVGHMSIVETYTGVLLGFIWQCHSISSRDALSDQLSPAVLQRVQEAVVRCLRFYITTGVLSSSSRGALERLLFVLMTSQSQTLQGEALVG